MNARLLSLCLLASAWAALGCNSGSSGPGGDQPDTGVIDPDVGGSGVDVGDVGGSGVDVGDVGGSDVGIGPDPTACVPPSGKGGHSIGSKIGNATFSGYPQPAATSAWTDGISLYGLCDATGAQHKLLWVSESGRWCGVCKDEAPIKAQLCRDYAARGLYCWETIADGNPASAPATKDDVCYWASQQGRPGVNGCSGNWSFSPAGDVLLDTHGDPNVFNTYFTSNTMPKNLLIDLTTMEIVDLVAGTASGTSAGLEAWFKPHLDKITNRVAAYQQ